MIVRVGRGEAVIGHWRLRIGRLYIGIRSNVPGCWHMFFHNKIDACAVAYFSFFGRHGEIRWYDT